MYFHFYSYKKGTKESLSLQVTPIGWLMEHDCYNGVVGPDGVPHLRRCVEENYTLVPPALGDAFEEIWQAARQDKLEEDEIQRRLNIFSEWVAAYNIHKQPTALSISWRNPINNRILSFHVRGMTYQYLNPESRQNETRRVLFPQPHARVPLLSDGGEVLLYQWGKRSQKEDPEYEMPVTGWARTDKLESGYWKYYQSTEVLIPALRFSEKGKLPKSKWFDMPQDTYLMGLKIEKRDKNFIYIVTNPAIAELEKIHPRMLLVVGRLQPDRL